ncbi:MAG: hypothetical protein GWN01_16200 [Nitrosopumilaceae archaeon]|nr:hypothetical protein [Nitrosopumilaceae archaeon]NIU02379.1 hypothetical protein [Nitrosopumilaceae archaeon]NIU88836.1 hypothetical protein [Nitrosopumilaceae archaeon]NIV66960.1 hypothetical protein [Nitrosopumilaceae archaeon]NIX62980.1 hypothetical protein [Nitrosopumilaceae archaeon]
MSRIKVKVKDIDDDIPTAKSLELSGISGSIKTPMRAFHLKKETTSESRLIQNDKIRGLNEVYHVLSKEKINDIDSNVDKLKEWGKNLRYIFSYPKIKDEMNLLFFNYENKETGQESNSIPEEKEIEYLCNIVTHPESEVVIPPIIYGLSGGEYLEFLKKFFRFLKSYSKNQEIMGMIPLVATSELREINQFYLEQGIRLFTVDFAGNYPMDSYLLINEIRKMTEFIATEYKEDSFLHAFNVPLSRAQPTTYVSPAKDILTYLSGFDSFGSYHKKEPKPPEVIEKIKEKIEQKKLEAKKNKTRYIPSFRLFNRGDYGYYKNDATRLEVIFKDRKDEVIKLSDLSDPEYSESKLKGLRKAYNVERHALESNDYQSHIHENSLKQHIQKKKYGVENFNKILRVIH